jgi:hypothetical protein
MLINFCDLKSPPEIVYENETLQTAKRGTQARTPAANDATANKKPFLVYRLLEGRSRGSKDLNDYSRTNEVGSIGILEGMQVWLTGSGTDVMRLVCVGPW